MAAAGPVVVARFLGTQSWKRVIRASCYWFCYCCCSLSIKTSAVFYPNPASSFLSSAMSLLLLLFAEAALGSRLVQYHCLPKQHPDYLVAWSQFVGLPFTSCVRLFLVSRRPPHSAANTHPVLHKSFTEYMRMYTHNIPGECFFFFIIFSHPNPWQFVDLLADAALTSPSFPVSIFPDFMQRPPVYRGFRSTSDLLTAAVGWQSLAKSCWKLARHLITTRKN